ncbi:unnamed protein product [Symbiodinium microadriaticum]|nr:unnamed protein product [Symbiodinium microadriaticum]
MLVNGAIAPDYLFLSGGTVGLEMNTKFAAVTARGPRRRLLRTSRHQPGAHGGGKGVHQVQEETSSSPSSTATTVAAPTQQPVHPAAKAVRRIKLSTPPTAATTEIFDISEDTVAEFALEPADPDFVQMVTATTAEDPPVEEDEPALIILDSGPTQDAQGNKIDGGARRKFDFWFEAADGKHFAVPEQCVVGNVQVPLLAVGKLLRRGWQIINDGELKPQEPFGRAAKVAFRHNSLALRGHIRAVTLSTPSLAAVRVLTDHPRGPHGIKGHYAPNAFKLMDGRAWYDADVFSARTTLVKKTNGSWIQIENSSDYAYEARTFGPIANRGCERITLFRMESFGEGFFEGRGMAPKASTRFAAESEDEPLTFLPPREPATPEQPRQPETPKPDEPEEPDHTMETDEGELWLEPGYWKHGGTRKYEPNQSKQTEPNTEDNQSEQTEPDTEDSPHEQTEPDTENSQCEPRAEESQRLHGEGTQLDPEVVSRMNAWMEDNVLPLLGVAPGIEARPLGATSSQDPHPLPGQPQTTRGILQPGSVNLNRRVRFAPNWGYGYHVATCSSFRRAARYFQDTTVKEALERGLFPCEQCCRGDHDTLLSLNRGYFEQKPRRKRR